MSSPCVTGVSYPLAADWDRDGAYTGTGEDVTDQVPYAEPVTVSWGRDQKRDLSPVAPGKLTFSLLNTDGRYSPENPSPPLSGAVRVGRMVRWQADNHGVITTLFEGPIDSLTVQAERTEARVDFEALDGFEQRNNANLSTRVYATIRTGEAIAVILDAIAWPADKRDLDYGSTVIPYWWAEDVTAPDAVAQLVASEGPPAMFFVANGVATFRDRHHRLTRARSTDVQATYCVTGIGMDCDPVASPCPTGSFGYSRPFGYEHGMRDITNVAAFTVSRRARGEAPTEVFSDDLIRAIDDGETAVIKAASTSDPFVDAITPVAGTDFTVLSGSVTVALTRTSGQSATILVTATGGPARISGMHLRATVLAEANTHRAEAIDVASRDEFGEQRWPNDAPWAQDPYTAQALADVIVGRGAQPRPILSLRVVAGDDATLTEVLSRAVSDRLHVRNDEHYFDDDVHVEFIAHTATRAGSNRPLHITTLGVEKAADPPPAIPFIFDEVGHGFDDGYFDGNGMSNPETLFIFDEVGHGFDDGKFAL